MFRWNNLDVEAITFTFVSIPSQIFDRLNFNLFWLLNINDVDDEAFELRFA